MLQIIATYLRKYEGIETYGVEDFWLLVHYFLLVNLGRMSSEDIKTEWKKYHDYDLEHLFEELHKTFEFSPRTLGQLEEIISSYQDEDTGFEIALLQLQTQFYYSGKPNGRLVQIRASRFS